MSASRMGARLVPVLASVHDRPVRDFPLIRSYVMKDGHLLLALMADGGTYVPVRTDPADQARGCLRSEPPVCAHQGRVIML
jgi:hypothetical protein